MKVLFVVAARGGSKGVPRKNIRFLGGIPLIAYKIVSAQKCCYEHRIIVSTDDEEIADIAKGYGADVPFMRPEELSGDTASSIDVVLHAMDWITKNDSEKYNYVCLLEPSSPFASYEDLNASLKLIEEKQADTLLGMKEVEVSSDFIHPLDKQGGLSEFYFSMENMTSIRRQDQRQEYTMNGCMYIARWDYFMNNKQFHSVNSVPYIMSEEKSIEIDTLLDYEIACMLVEKRIIDIGLWK